MINHFPYVSRNGVGVGVLRRPNIFKAPLDGFDTSAFTLSTAVLYSSQLNEPMFRIRRSADDNHCDVLPDTSVKINGTYFIRLDSPVQNFETSSAATTLGEFVASSGYSDPDSLGSASDWFCRTAYDPSGNGRDATQATAASQPQMGSAGALVTDSLGNPSVVGTAASTLNLPTGFNVRSVFGIAQFEATVESFGGWAAFDTIADPASNIRKNVTNDIYRRNLVNEFIQNSSGIIRVNGAFTESFTNGVVHIATFIRDSARVVRDSPVLFGGDSSRRFNGGKLSVAILYPSDQSVNRAAIEAKLAEIYNITLA